MQGELCHSEFISSLHNPLTQTGYGFLSLPFKNTVFYLTEEPFIFVNPKHIFKSTSEMEHYFQANPLEKIDGVVAVITSNGESFHVCELGVFKQKFEMRQRVKHANSIEIRSNATSLNFYINDNVKSVFHIKSNDYDGFNFKDVYKIRFINNVGDEFAFRAFSF